MVSKGRVFVILAVLVALVLSDQVSDRVGSRNKLEAKVEEKVLLESCLEAARYQFVGSGLGLSSRGLPSWRIGFEISFGYMVLGGCNSNGSLSDG
eukprot:1317738-Amorphochlora_amoeboformis.AAC.3